MNNEYSVNPNNLHNLKKDAEIADYILHTEKALSIRSLSRKSDVHPSTISRRVQRIELMRDDPLFDAFLSSVTAKIDSVQDDIKDVRNMVSKHRERLNSKNNSTETIRLLRRLGETGAFLAVTSGLENALVFREVSGGKQVRTAVMSAELAQTFLTNDWISKSGGEKVVLYRITEAGRAALRRMLAESSGVLEPVAGFAEAPTSFGEQHREWGDRVVRDTPFEKARKVRVNLRESPISGLARKKDKNGKPYLSNDLVDAGERLREDFELSQMGPKVTQNWENFMTAGTRGGPKPTGVVHTGSDSARERMQAAMEALGPDLGDIALRCCCFLEGLEAAEKRMGWSARSGKIVLRIALQRLRIHYDHYTSNADRMIG